MELIFVTRACCSPAGGHSWPSFFLFFLFTAYTTSPVLIGRPDATLSKATGCAVYQLTSAYRTKEQMSGWWASASLPSEFFFKKKQKQKTTTAPLLGEVIPPERGQLYCWKYWLCWATGKISEQRHVSHGAGVLKVSAPDDHNAAQYPRTSRLIPRHPRLLSTTKKIAPPFSFFAGIWKRCLCKISPVPNGKAPRRTVHTCSLQVWTKAHRWKFMCPWLGQARWSSMQVSMLLVFYPLPRL